MDKNSIIQLFARDLDRLYAEVNSYNNSENLWIVKGEIINSGGNLCLHLVGNLNHFIGAVLGATGYIRNRHDEFNLKHVERKVLLDEILNTKQIVSKVLDEISEEQWDEIYPLEVFGQPMKTEYFLIHLYGHLNYHLGQINYHRRLLDGVL